MCGSLYFGVTNVNRPIPGGIAPPCRHSAYPGERRERSEESLFSILFRPQCGSIFAEPEALIMHKFKRDVTELNRRHPAGSGK
jgi:hypothetical protein